MPWAAIRPVRSRADAAICPAALRFQSPRLSGLAHGLRPSAHVLSLGSKTGRTAATGVGPAKRCRPSRSNRPSASRLGDTVAETARTACIAPRRRICPACTLRRSDRAECVACRASKLGGRMRPAGGHLRLQAGACAREHAPRIWTDLHAASGRPSSLRQPAASPGTGLMHAHGLAIICVTSPAPRSRRARQTLPPDWPSRVNEKEPTLMALSRNALSV